MVSVEELSEVEDIIESLHARVDGLQHKLKQLCEALDQAQEKFDALPGIDTIEEFTTTCDRIRIAFEHAAEAWNSDAMPGIEELRELARETASIGMGD